MTAYCSGCGCTCAGNSYECDRVGPPCRYCGCGTNNAGPFTWDSDGNILGENNTMLPTPQEQSNGGSRRRGSRAPKEGYSIPFLTVENLTSEPQVAKITGIKATPDSRYSDVQLKLSLRGTSYFWGVKASWPVFKVLFDAFGHDEQNWVGKEIKMFQEFDNYSEKNFIGASVDGATKTPAKRGR